MQIYWNKRKRLHKKLFNSHGTVLGHKHGRRFIRLREVSLFPQIQWEQCTRAEAAKPRDARNEGDSPRRKKRDCTLSQSQWIKRWPHNAKYDWLICEALTSNCQQSKPLTSWWWLKHCRKVCHFSSKKNIRNGAKRSIRRAHLAGYVTWSRNLNAQSLSSLSRNALVPKR